MKVLKKIKSLIFSSIWYECQPLTIIEAYSNDLPVISSNVGNTKELVKNGVTGLHFETNNVDSLINVVNQFEKLDLDEMKKNAYDEYENKYNKDIGYNNLIKIYERVIESNQEYFI